VISSPEWFHRKPLLPLLPGFWFLFLCSCVLSEQSEQGLLRSHQRFCQESAGSDLDHHVDQHVDQHEGRNDAAYLG
jgi:hypothetical protein